MIEELTIEITNYCPHGCAYCSSDTTASFSAGAFLQYDRIMEVLGDRKYEHIIISGGEPLAHPDFYKILILCERHSDDVVVYSNAIKHLIYNQGVLDGVYLEANVTVLPEVDRVHILRRVKQGREKDRPEVHLSQNFHEDCTCEHRILRPDGVVGRTPCDKWHLPVESVEEKASVE